MKGRKQIGQQPKRHNAPNEDLATYKYTLFSAFLILKDFTLFLCLRMRGGPDFLQRKQYNVTLPRFQVSTKQ